MADRFEFTVEDHVLILKTESKNLEVFGNSKHAPFPVRVIWIDDETVFMACPETAEEDFKTVKTLNEEAPVKILKDKEIQVLLKGLKEHLEKSMQA